MNRKNQKQQRLSDHLDAAEQRRLQELTGFEREARKAGYHRIAGVDEAGRGPLAGPVVAAACIIPCGLMISGIDDSKKLTQKKRAFLFERLSQDPQILHGIGRVSSQEIDCINILRATILAMQSAIANLACQPDRLLVDGLELIHAGIPCQKIIKGDSRSYCIAAASILAKEARDRMMREYHEQWPQYGFDQHKGYGTQKHREAIQKYGPCPIHRMTFEPVKSMVTRVGKALN